jgi:hypothetical protein
MAYKSKTVTMKDASFLLEELKDFLVTDCGWTDETPAGQDDEMGAGDYHGILGHFLRSTGEDGLGDICMHLFTGKETNIAQHYTQSHVFPACSYLTAGIDDSVMAATVDDVGSTGLANVDTPFGIRMGDEIAIVTDVTAGAVTFSQRGAYGTTPASHSTGDLVIDTLVMPFVEVYAFQDVTEALIASSGTSAVGLDAVTNVPGADGYGDARFNLHGMLKIVDGAEAGKMRPITDYTSANGDFDYVAFKNAPGTANVAVVAMGFLPALSRRVGTANYAAGRIDVADQGTDTVAWFYGSKDSVIVITKFNAGYNMFYAGNVLPFSAKDTALSTDTATAGTNTMDVDNRNIFSIGEKFRIISQDVADWAVNEVRASEDDLDPEEIPTEEVVIQGITPGGGNTGTLTFNSNLLFTYATGAVVGEDPRPACRSAPDYARITGASNDVMEGTDCWLPVYNPCEKTAITAHASHRQVWRSVHATGDPTTRYEVDLYSRLRGYGSRKVNALGIYLASLGDNLKNKQNERPTCGLVTLYVPDGGVTYNNRGVFAAVKGTLLNMWFPDVNSTIPPYGAVAEDTYEARWGGTYEEFRLFPQRASTSVYGVFGPEIA